MNWLAGFDFLASAATAIGVAVAAYQLRLSKQHALTQFEDEIYREYREIIKRLPVKALLGEDLDEEEYALAMDEFFYYIDLCNQQIYLRRQGRVRADTWSNWREGIRSNLTRPAFRRAWEEIKTRSDSFHELRQLESCGFDTDPASWEQVRDDHTPLAYSYGPPPPIRLPESSPQTTKSP